MANMARWENPLALNFLNGNLKRWAFSRRGGLGKNILAAQGFN
jgi:hypothetical protein